MKNTAKTMVYHQVVDFSQWKKVFDSLSEIRLAAGELSAEIGTLHDDPKTVYVINEWTSMEAAIDFFGSADLVVGMQKAGVVNKPQFLFLDQK